jgi:uncharacterized membrane protein YhaH (DUF805 family)
MDKLITYTRRAVLENYANFSGRDDRPQYWWFVLGVTIVYFALNVVTEIASGLTGLLVLFFLGLLVPSIAAATRRLHDTGRSGLWQLLLFIPLIGPIVLIVFCAQPGQPQENSYGPPPSSAALDPAAGTGYPPPPPPPPPPAPPVL